MCSLSLGESAELAFNGRKNKKHFLLNFVCNLFAYRQTRDVHTRQTRTTSVIFPPYADKTDQNKTSQHSILQYKTWDTHPYASSEGTETTSLGKYMRRSTTRSLGAAMGLTALRQTEDISRHPTTYKHQKPIPDLKIYSPSHLPCKCKSISANKEKCGRA